MAADATALPTHVQAKVEGLDGGVHSVSLKRKYVGSIEILAKALAKAFAASGLPASSAPPLEALRKMKMKISLDFDGANRVKVDPSDPAGLARAASEAYALFAWMPKK